MVALTMITMPYAYLIYVVLCVSQVFTGYTGFLSRWETAAFDLFKP